MKLKYKYQENEIMPAMQKLLNLSRSLEKNKEYGLEYISSRTGVILAMCLDILDYLCDGGFYTKGKNGEYYILD